ncbi:hypothetical protein SOM26_16670 [Sphingomonas sp. CFBP8993]|uniref:hypothetical protein n=1 Tax=Sphingomonas sp. CFBP8993 TaxID=3096526 RepID=UPI002A6B7EE3|nr:hypothetical protein [Sphingomonas sp. CFBP8993]MDY0960327.1 hypothetical protein [Sphingomonas sp. CFBP8993]
MTEHQSTSGGAIYNHFFEHGEVRSEFTKEYISLWSGWLGMERLNLLDEVSEVEWLSFNQMLLATFKAFRMGVASRAAETVEFPAELEPLLDDYQASMQKDGSQFSQFVIPGLDCVLTEEWDYIYILWHRNNGALEAIEPLLGDAKLKHFSD